MKKMLLMGSSGAGKTSMHSVIFANYPAKDTSKIGYTVERQEHKFKFMGALTLNLWDCGGQDTFMEQYFLVQSEKRLKKSLQWWSQTLKSIQQYNENANIFVLIHKIDKIQDPTERKKKFEEKKEQIDQVLNKTTQKVKVKNYFGTSIWDQTLYQAWSQVVQLLIPNRQFIKDILKKFCQVSMCNEAVLYQRSTFLILCFHDESNKEDLLKYEKVANIIKQFKLTCNKIPSNIEAIEVNTASFTAMIHEFTSTENILAIYNNKQIRSQTVAMNIANLGKHYLTKKQSSFGKD